MVSIPTTPATPNCSRCGARGAGLTRLITRRSNRNGNAGRPYLKCLPCNNFITFDDLRGANAGHLPCDCDEPSRLQLAGRTKGRKLHYVCAVGACTFYAPAVDRKGDQVTLTEDLVQSFADLNII